MMGGVGLNLLTFAIALVIAMFEKPQDRTERVAIDSADERKFF